MSTEDFDVEAGCGKSDQKRLVMFQSLTKSDIEKFEFVAETPAGGMAYYCNEYDFTVVNYKDRSRFFYDRRTTHGKSASSFNKSVNIERT